MQQQYPALTPVIHQAVIGAPSGLKAETIAEFLGKPYGTLMNELNGQPGHKLGADLLLPLMKLSKSDTPLNFLAREMGGIYIPLPFLTAGYDNGKLMNTLAGAIKEFGEFVSEVGQGVADGKLTYEEMERIRKEGYEALQATLATLELAETTYKSQYKG